MPLSHCSARCAASPSSCRASAGVRGVQIALIRYFLLMIKSEENGSFLSISAGRGLLHQADFDELSAGRSIRDGYIVHGRGARPTRTPVPPFTPADRSAR